ncbi:MAG TPA: TonB-dependent siderophore receptor [Pseudomonadales bacterium]|nr:TonB-dependent siderophore receptor [Pseudomonadales bacterium]
MSIHVLRPYLLSAGSAGVLMLALASGAQAAEELVQKDRQLETVTVTAEELGDITEQTQSYTTGEMETATKMELSIRETPQSVSVVTRTQMDDFKMESIKDVLEHTTGVTVEQVETDRTYYTARGFEINNFQQDGLPVPLSSNIMIGDIDTAIYDRVEVVRGATGLMSGTGSPAAAINMVRKRPTDEFQSSVRTSAGSWDNYRLDADVSGRLDNKLGGRLVVAQQSKDSYLDNYSRDLTVIYGVTDFKFNEATKLTLGLSRQDGRSNSPMWGAVPMLYSNGMQTDFDVSTSTSADWSFWDTVSDEVFVEMEHKFNEDWKLVTRYNHNDYEGTTQLFYQYAAWPLIGPVMDTGLGMNGWTGRYEDDVKTDALDTYLSGKFLLGGREHEVVMGLSHAKKDYTENPFTDPAYGFPSVGNFNFWKGNIAEPDFWLPGVGADYVDKEKGAYLVGRFRLADPLSLITGVRVVDWKSDGYSYGPDYSAKETGKTLPYAGLVYDINKNWSTYASYTKTFSPQDETGTDLSRIAPTEGENREIGIKSSWFDQRLNTTFAIFGATHDNLATFQRTVMVNKKPTDLYEGVDFDSNGYEMEIAGELMPGLEATIGYTYVDIDDGVTGVQKRAYIPKSMLRSAFSYRLPQMDAVKVGASIDWQSGIEDATSQVHQDSYLLADAFVSYDFTKHLSGSLNVNNITDEKYLNSLNWSQAYYGTPRNVMASLTWKY